jgi:hypothetical protein
MDVAEETTPANLPISVEGRTKMEAIRNAEKALGGPVRVLTTSNENEGGILGFFEKRRVKILVQRDLTPSLTEIVAGWKSRDEDGDLILDISPEAFQLAQELREMAEAPLADLVDPDPVDADPIPAPPEALREEEHEEHEELAEEGENPAEPPAAEPEILAADTQPEAEEPEPEPEPFDFAGFAAAIQERLDESESVSSEPVEAPTETLAPLSTVAPAAVPRMAPIPSVALPLTLAEELVASGLAGELIDDVLGEVAWLGALTARNTARTILAAKVSPAQPIALSKLRNLLIAGKRSSGRSTLIAHLVRALSASDQKIAVASVGSMDDPGTTLLRRVAFEAGAFHTWVPEPSDPALAALSKEVDLLLIDMDGADPALHAEAIASVRKSVYGKLNILATVPTGDVLEDTLLRLNGYPAGLVGLAATFGDRLSRKGELANLAAFQRKPILFLSDPAQLSLFDPAALAAALLP